MTKHISVGLIGGGGIADAHIRGYRTHADKISVAAVADAVEASPRPAARSSTPLPSLTTRG